MRSEGLSLSQSYKTVSFEDVEHQEYCQMAKHVHERAIKAYNEGKLETIVFSLGCNPYRLAEMCEHLFPIQKIEVTRQGRILRVFVEALKQDQKTEPQTKTQKCCIL